MLTDIFLIRKNDYILESTREYKINTSIDIGLVSGSTREYETISLIFDSNVGQISFLVGIFLKNPCGRYRIWTCDFFLVREALVCFC